MEYKVEELLPIVSKMARKYAGFENTSISYEKAQMLMEAVIYCLDAYGNYTSDKVSRRDISVEEQYAIGAELVLERTGRIREMFNELSTSFEAYGVKCLEDTVRKGIPEFLKWYDAKFCPQDTLLTLDYPVLADLSPYRGVDAIWHFLRAISAEQRFLGRFDSAYVRAVLEIHNPQYPLMYDNICEILLANTLGHLFLRKSLQETGFSEEEYAALCRCFSAYSASRTEEEVKRVIGELARQFYPDDGELLEYLCGDAGNLAVRILETARFGTPERIFLF